MRVVALMTVRNEALYLRRALEHLIAQGVETCVIDNNSTDETPDIARSFLGAGVCQVERYPYPGYHDLAGALSNEERLSSQIQTDWLMHCDADEIRQPPRPFTTLVEGAKAAEREGYNAVNFDEFQFVPRNAEESFEGKDYVALMRHYFYPRASAGLFRTNLWKKTSGKVDLVSMAGHQVLFEGRKVSPVRFILRHYVALSFAHGVRKYRHRFYSPEEILERRWHAGALYDPETKKHYGSAAWKGDEPPFTDVLTELLPSGDFDTSNPQ